MDKDAFRFSIKPGGRYVWANDRYKLIFHSPVIQAFDDYVQMKDESTILYCYYHAEMYRRDWQNKWRLFTSVHTHDFPAVCALKRLLEWAARTNIKTGAQRYGSKEDGYVYYKTRSTDDILADDFYEITRFHYTPTGRERYTFRMGAEDMELRIPVTSDDLDELYACVTAFLEESIRLHNEGCRLWLEQSAQKYRCRDGAFEVLGGSEDAEGRFLPDGSVAERYVPGDCFSSLDALPDGLETAHTLECRDAELLSAGDDGTITVRWRWHGEEKEAVIPIQTIVYTYKGS